MLDANQMKIYNISDCMTCNMNKNNYIPRLTGFGANRTFVGLHNSSSWPGRTDKHNDISICDASVQTPCDNNKVVLSFQLFSVEK